MKSIRQARERRAILWTMLIATLLAIGAGSAAAASSVPDGYQLVAENDVLEMYLNPETTSFIFVDRRNGRLWSTNPMGDTSRIASALWQTHARSQLFFGYTDEKRRQIRETDPITEGARVAYEPIENGVRIVYTMQNRGFVITTDYVLGEDYFEVRVPDAGIQERGDFSLVYLDLLPFFGAATDDDEGYMVFPDSSGAIAPFGKRHGRYARQFEEYVYGPEDYPFVEYLPLQPVNRQVAMPIFGLKYPDGAFLGVITEGEFDAKVVAAPAGYIVDYYRTNAKFVLRREYLAPLRQDTTVPTVESQRIRTDRAVRYYLLPESQASYAGMALKYREYLVEEMGLAPGRVAGDDGVAPIHLRIFHAVMEERLVFNSLVVMTTFDEARQMVEELLAAGVKEMDVTLVGWNRGGYAGRYPRRLPVEQRLGGERGLKEFVEWARERGVRVYLQDNYIDAYADNRGFSRRTEVVRDPSRLPIRGWSPGYRSDRYLISPMVAYQKFALKDIPKMAEFGVTGLDLERFGWTLISDRNANYRAERDQVAKVWSDIVRLAKEQMGSVIVQGGNVYLLPLVDKVMRSPMEETTHLFASRSIPFYQIAVHGVVPYYGWPSNLRSEPLRGYLKNIEYGALPVFELTMRSSSLLKDATRYNILFSSEFELWKDTFIDEYRTQSERMGYLQDIAIVDHRELAEDVFETVYEDGSRVIVNYSDRHAWTDGEIVVEPLQFIHIGGGIRD